MELSIPADVNENVKVNYDTLRPIFHNCADIVFRTLKLTDQSEILLVYIEELTDSNKLEQIISTCMISRDFDRLTQSLIGVITAVWVIATFGTNIGSTLIFPYFSMVRFINYLGFIQNMDVWIMFIWIFNVFVKLAIYLFINHRQAIEEAAVIKPIQDAKPVPLLHGFFLLADYVKLDT